jgi:hypothetical protein
MQLRAELHDTDLTAEPPSVSDARPGTAVARPHIPPVSLITNGIMMPVLVS